MSDSVPLRKSFYQYLTSFLILILFAIPVYSESSRNIPFLRTTDTALQTSVYTLISKDTNVRIRVIGVIHIADLQYYQKIQKIIDDLDYLFYEEIRRSPKKAKAEINNLPFIYLASQVIDENETKKSIRENSEFKNEVANVLNFANQVEHLKPKSNWINADMDFSQFMQLLNKYQIGFHSLSSNLSIDSKSFFEDYFELFHMEPGKTSEYNLKVTNLKKKMSQNLVQSCMELCFLEEMKVSREAIIVERNKVALSYLKSKLTSQIPLELGLLYGIAHTPNFVEILTRDYNFEIESYEWLDAWSLEN